jgi:hypothetical protein
MDSPRRSKEIAMCHGFEWEMYYLARKREAERNREKARTEGGKPPTTTAAPKPADAPVKERLPEPA